jgi:hypothetical protein
MSSGSGVAHSLQYLESEGLSVSHFGHLIFIIPLALLEKNNKECEKSQNVLFPGAFFSMRIIDIANVYKIVKSINHKYQF